MNIAAANPAASSLKELLMLEIQDIHKLNMKDKSDRIKMVKETAKLLKMREKPTLEELENYCMNYYKEKGYGISTICCKKNNIEFSIKVSEDSYSIQYAITLYEMFCKTILTLNVRGKLK